jgi:hypothetical protein
MEYFSIGQGQAMAALWDEFHAAMQVLVGAGPVKQRLIDAYSRHLFHVREQDMPDALAGRFTTLRAAMHEAAPTGGLTAAAASVRKMSERDAAAHATSIFEMFVALSAENESAPRLRIVTNENADTFTDDLFEVPAFLSRA